MTTTNGNELGGVRKWFRLAMVAAVALSMLSAGGCSSTDDRDEVLDAPVQVEEKAAEKTSAKGEQPADSSEMTDTPVAGEYEVEIFLPNGNTWPGTGEVALDGTDMTVTIDGLGENAFVYEGTYDPETRGFTAANELEEVSITFTIVDGQVVGEGYNYTPEEDEGVEYRMTKK